MKRPVAVVSCVLAFHALAALGAYGEIVWTRPLCKEPGGYIGWPSVTRCADGRILAVFSGDRDGHICPWGKVQMVESHDCGETWSVPRTVRNSPLDDRDAGILELKNGDLLLTWFTSLAFTTMKGNPYARHAAKIQEEDRIKHLGHFTMRSTDGGKTWEKPVPTCSSAPHGGIQLKDGRVVTGRNSDDMHAASAMMLNAIKALAGIPEQIPLISPDIIKSITHMKHDILKGGSYTSLNLDEAIIGLAISCTMNPAAQIAAEKLNELRGCEVHMTHIVTPGDEAGLRRLGCRYTSDPYYATNALFTAGQ